MRIRSALLTVFTTLAATVLGVAPTLDTHAADGPGDVGFYGEIDAPTLLLGGTGTFQLNNHVCLFADVDDLTVTGGCTLTANGTFNSIVCGTESLDGTASITPDPSDGGIEFLNLHIQTVAGYGVISGAADGVVQLVPNDPYILPPTCTDHFLVVGDVIIP